MNTVYSSRAVPAWFGGRPDFYSPFSPAAWGRSGGMCAPIQQCCCIGPYNIAPGAVEPIMVDWRDWPALTDPGTQFSLYQVEAISLTDMSKSPPAPADPDIIKVTSGIATLDPDPLDNADIPASLIKLIPPFGANVLIKASENAVIGTQYKLDICGIACDGCDGRKIRRCKCVVITIAEC